MELECYTNLHLYILILYFILGKISKNSKKSSNEMLNLPKWKRFYTSTTSAASDIYHLCLYSIILLVYNVIPNRNNFLETTCNKVQRPKGYIPVLWMIYTAAIQIATEVIFHLKPLLTFCGHIFYQNNSCLEISFHFAFEYFLLVDVWCRWLRRACPCPNGHCPKCQIGNFWSVGSPSKHRKIHKFVSHTLEPPRAFY